MSDQTIQDSVIDKIHKLSAMANHGTEHEASNAASLIQALLAKYNLDMAQVTQRAPEKVGIGDSARVRQTGNNAAMYKFQQTLMRYVADNNFCSSFIVTVDVPHEKKFGETRSVKRFNLLGSKMNVTVALHLYDYLTQTMDRLLPYQGMEKRGKNALLWLDGCSSRLGYRLYMKKQEMIKESEAQRAEQQASQTPSASPTEGALVLADVYSSEEDLNQDFLYGWKPGATAQYRRDAQARAASRTQAELAEMEAGWAKIEAEEKRKKAERLAKETPSQRQARLDRERRDQERRDAKWDREANRNQAKVNNPAWRAGSRAGDEIGLDTQVTNQPKRRIA